MTPDSAPSSPTRLPFDAERLDRFIRSRLSGLQGDLHVDPIRGGQSNPTFFLHYRNRSLVLRKQPGGALLPSAHAVDREYRVMAALARTGLPVPPVLLYHADADVLDTPFYLMEKVPGRVFFANDLPDMAPETRRQIYQAMADTLATLHQVDWQAIGLADFGRPHGYFERQIRRWQKQWSMTEGADNPALDRLLEWLQAQPFEDDETTLTHGDYKLNNLLFHPVEPRVVAVLDWELSTLGHPLADLAFNTIVWHTLPHEYGGIRGLDLAALGIPDETEYLRQYYRLTGRDQPARQVQPRHLAFALMRMAVIFEGIAARARAGNAVADDAATIGAMATAMTQRGLEAADL